jgi:type II secretory pathway pseudopilin PulG
MEWFITTAIVRTRTTVLLIPPQLYTALGTRDSRLAAARRISAFTLVELSIVIAIVVALFAITFGVSTRVRRIAKERDCLARLSQFGRAASMYANDNDDSLPPYVSDPFNALVPDERAKLHLAFNPYGIKDEEFWRCPLAYVGWWQDAMAITVDQKEGTYGLTTVEGTDFVRFYHAKLSSARTPASITYLTDERAQLPNSGTPPDYLTPHELNFGNALYLDMHVARFRAKNDAAVAPP